CIESVQWADEIIVIVDEKSNDKTEAIAQSFGIQVFKRPWEGYGGTKNFGLSRSTGEWILWLDADERVTPELKRELLGVIKENSESVKAYSIPRKAYFLGKWIKHCGWYPGYVLRVFQRTAGKFSDHKVHERLDISGEMGYLRSDLLHYTDPNLFHYFEKFNRYTSLAADELELQRYHFKLSDILIRPVWKFLQMYIVRAGFLDGIQGFILCILSAGYVFSKYAKLWEKTRMETNHEH
ncbi:MAG: glycosyltransferase family 2 protein, partial [bacterium]